jgi:hypothetical protein
MAQFRSSGFVNDDSLKLEKFGSFAIQHGEIACLGMLVITVVKTMEFVSINGDGNYVQTTEYTYNLSVRGRNNVFRCDNAHPEHKHPGHETEHHQHFFNWKTGDELRDSPRECKWPTLSEFIEMARGWYYDNHDKLDSPDEFVSELRDGVQW